MTSLADPTVAEQQTRRGWAAPAWTAAAVLAATGYIATVDPNENGHYPLCPLKSLTGLDCPGCGGLRCVHSLTRGDVAGAADHNLLAVLLLPIAVLAWAEWLRRRLGGRAGLRWPAWATPTLVVVTLVFTVVRNIPGVPFLGSGIG